MNDLLKPLGESKTIGAETDIRRTGSFEIFESDYHTRDFYSIRIAKFDSKREIIGILQIHFSGRRSKKGTISQIHVKDTHRRLGIATSLLNYAKRYYSVSHSKDLTKDGEAWKKSL